MSTKRTCAPKAFGAEKQKPTSQEEEEALFIRFRQHHALLPEKFMPRFQ
jgi:hypothetical protein